MSTTHEIIFGDARSMKAIPNESVHLVITSPPYWELKDYGCKNQIGYGQTYEEYLASLAAVWGECYRVLLAGCRLCINVADFCAATKRYGRFRLLPIPAEVTVACVNAGFDFLGAIIWQKITNCNPSGGARVMGSYPYPRNGIVKQDHEYILVFRKPGTAVTAHLKAKRQSRLTKQEWNTYFRGHWHISGVRQRNHCAQFSVELPRRLIRMYSFIGETVLDPFLGSGTTTLAAVETGRNSIGYEINRDFRNVIWTKLQPVLVKWRKTTLHFSGNRFQRKTLSRTLRSRQSDSL